MKKTLITLVAISVVLLANAQSGTQTANTVRIVTSATEIRDAINDLNSGDTIRVYNDIQYESYNHILFENGKDLVLDLYGKTLSVTKNSSDAFIEIAGGTLTIVDTSKTGTGKIVNNATPDKSKAISISSNGSLILKGGTIEAIKGILHKGNSLNILGGNISGKSYYAIETNSALTISGGVFSGNTNVIRLASGATCDISGGEFSSKTDDSVIKVETDKPVNITGGYFSKTVTPTSGYYCNDNIEAATKSSYPYHVSNNSLKYYAGNGTELTDTISAARWTKLQTDAPNAMAVVSKDYSTWAQSQTNILVKDGESYTCSDFTLTDLEDFYSPYNFTAEKASYTRATTVQYNSMCLPFALTPDDVNGTIYKFSSSTDDTITMSAQSAGIDAGVPCIVKANNPGTALTITKEDVAVSCNINDNYKIKGSYVLDTYIGAGKYKLNSAGTAFGITTAAGKCYPFRSYLDLGTSTEAKSSLSVNWSDTPSGLNAIVESTGDNIIKEFYNAAGIRHTAPSDGLNIVRTLDGRTIKCIIK